MLGPAAFLPRRRPGAKRASRRRDQLPTVARALPRRSANSSARRSASNRRQCTTIVGRRPRRLLYGTFVGWGMNFWVPASMEDMFRVRRLQTRRSRRALDRKPTRASSPASPLPRLSRNSPQSSGRLEVEYPAHQSRPRHSISGLCGKRPSNKRRHPACRLWKSWLAVVAFVLASSPAAQRRQIYCCCAPSRRDATK